MCSDWSQVVSTPVYLHAVSIIITRGTSLRRAPNQHAHKDGQPKAGAQCNVRPSHPVKDAIPDYIVLPHSLAGPSMLAAIGAACLACEGCTVLNWLCSCFGCAKRCCSCLMCRRTASDELNEPLE